MINIKRLENESFLDWKLRLITLKIDKTIDLDWVEIKDLLGLDCSGDHLRKTAYGIYEYKEYIQEKLQENFTEDEILKQLEETKREVYKERQKLRDEKNEYNAWLREQSRMELFYERIDESIEKILSKKNREIPKPIQVNKDDAKVVVAFADPHYGVEFSIKGFFDEIINEYNPKIFEKRMWELRDEIIDFCKINDTPSVSIVDLGDSIEGILHLTQLKSLRGDIVDHILDYADFIEDWLYNLQKAGLCIDFYTSEGNHSDLRLLTGKKGDFPHENLEKIYLRTIKKAFKDNPNVNIHDSLNGLNYFEVNGYKFLSAHGNKEKNLKNSISEYEDLYNIGIDFFLVGHLHSKNEFEVSKDKEVIQVRSIMGINEYSTDIKKTSKSGATMFSIIKDYGKKYVNEVKFV